jgi:filamentous hemagglutinin
VKAGGDVLIAANEDLTLISSKISAGNEAYLVAGDQIQVLAANDSDYSLYDKKDKGSWGSKKTRRDEITDVKAVSSEISAGGDITMLSGGDQTYQAAKLESGNDIAIVSGGAVTFEAVKDLHQEAHHKEDSDITWSSTKGKGNTDETVRQSQLTAEGEVVIKAVDGLHIDLKQIDQKNVSQTIDAMVKADPNLAWIKDAEARGDVDWRLVQEIHDSYKYSNNSLGAGPSLIISIVAAAYLGPVYGAMASNLAVGTINNGGDIGKGLEHAASADSLKNYAIAAATAYVVTPQLNEYFSATHDSINDVTRGFDLSTLEGIGNFAAYSIAQGMAQSVMQQAAFGGSYADNLGDAMAGQARNIGMAVGFNFIGDAVNYPPGSPQKVMAHALMGGLLAEAAGGDFKTGAAAAGANEAMIKLLSQMVGGDQNLELMASQIAGVMAAMAVNGDVNLGAQIAKSGTAYNSQLHDGAKKLAAALAEESDGRFTAEQIEAALRIASTDDGRTPATDMVVALPGIYDPAGNWIPLGNSGMYVQTFEKADPEVIAYIKENAAGYNWTSEAQTGFSKIFPNSGLGVGVESEQRDWLTGSVVDSDGRYTLGSLVGDRVYYPQYNSCADASCLIYGAGLDVGNASTDLYLRAKNVEDMNALGKIFSAGIIATPTGMSAATLSLFGYAATVGGGYYSGDLKSGGQNVFEDYLINYGLVKALGEAAGNRAAAGITAFDLKNAIKERAGELK